MYFKKCGEGNAILFLHGWGCDGSIFEPIVNKLPNSCNYLVDFVGFGKSGNPPIDGWNVNDYAKDVLRFLDEQKLSAITIVAHSFGCRVAMVLSALHPDRIKKLFLLAPAGIRKPSLKRWCKVARYKLHKFLWKMGLCQNVSSYYGSVDYNACQDALKNTFVKVVNQDLSKYAKKIECPTLIVNGTNDVQTPLKHAKCLNKLIKNSSLVQIEGGHFAFFANAFAFAKAVQIFEES